ncbi:MAG: PDZ domain-containing protein [Planctomycetota bacterium]
MIRHTPNRALLRGRHWLAIIALVLVAATCGCAQTRALPSGAAAVVNADAQFHENAGGAPPGDDDANGHASRTQSQVRELIERGKRALHDGELDTADANCRLALQLDPDHPDAAYQMGRIAACRGDRAAAVEWLRRAAINGMVEFGRMQRDPCLTTLRGDAGFAALLAERDKWLDRIADRRISALRAQLSADYTCQADHTHQLIIATAQGADFQAAVVQQLCAAAASLWRSMFDFRPEGWITIVLPTRQDFRRFVPDARIGGFYHPGRKLLVAQDVGYPLMHEFTHAMHFADLDGREAEQNIWFLEGVATLFENAGIVDGMPRPLPNSRLVMAQYLQSQGQLVPWFEFMRMDAAAYMQRAPEHYAQSRAMALWLHEQGVLRRYHETYCEMAERDPSGWLALERVFDGEPADCLEARWLAWLAALPPFTGAPVTGSPWLGLKLTRRTSDGVQVVELDDAGPAALSGLQPDDVIRDLGGQVTLSHDNLVTALSGYRAGDTVTIRIRRGTQQLQLTVRVDAWPGPGSVTGREGREGGDGATGDSLSSPR